MYLVAASMGDVNQLLIVKRNADLVRDPILEVGSRDYGNTPDLRALFPTATYLGVDLSEGKGVDLVLDLAGDFSRVDAALAGARFNTVICFSVLEHVANPFKMSENISALLRSGGQLFLSVPFSWKIHGYPSDYWRFTADGVRLLFPQIQFDPARSCMSTSVPEQIRPIDEFMYRWQMSPSAGLKRGQYGLFASLVVRLVRRLGVLPVVFDYPYVHPPVMINMIGSKRAP